MNRMPVGQSGVRKPGRNVFPQSMFCISLWRKRHLIDWRHLGFHFGYQTTSQNRRGGEISGTVFVTTVRNKDEMTSRTRPVFVPIHGCTPRMVLCDLCVNGRRYWYQPTLGGMLWLAVCEWPVTWMVDMSKMLLWYVDELMSLKSKINNN